MAMINSMEIMVCRHVFELKNCQFSYSSLDSIIENDFNDNSNNGNATLPLSSKQKAKVSLLIHRIKY